VLDFQESLWAKNSKGWKFKFQGLEILFSSAENFDVNATRKIEQSPTIRKGGSGRR